MAWYDTYTNRTGNNIPSTDYFKYALQSKVDEIFTISSDYYVIQKKDRVTGILTDIGVRVTSPYYIKEKYTLIDDYRVLLFPNNNTIVNLGDIFQFNNYTWMVIDTGALETSTNSCEVQRCNVQLKFTAATPLSTDVIIIDGIATNKLTSINEDRFVPLPSGEMIIYVPASLDVEKIKYAEKGGTRFLLGYPYHSYNVINIDSVTNVRPNNDGITTNGYVVLKLKQTPISNTKDDLVNGVAWQDYF